MPLPRIPAVDPVAATVPAVDSYPDRWMSLLVMRCNEEGSRATIAMRPYDYDTGTLKPKEVGEADDSISLTDIFAEAERCPALLGNAFGLILTYAALRFQQRDYEVKIAAAEAAEEDTTELEAALAAVIAQIEATA